MEDVEGNIYKTVKIGNQEWMAENLNVSQFRNGDLIPEAKTKEAWLNAGKESKPVWCYYDNNPENGKKYGKLYNWYAVNDLRGLAPEEWHISTKENFESLILEVSKDGNALKAKGQGTGSGAGTNTSGFSALLAGYRGYSGYLLWLRLFRRLHIPYFWSSTEHNAANAYYMSLNGGGSYVYLSYSRKEDGFSVRCVKDKSIY